MNKGKLRSLMFHAGFCNEDGGWDNRPIFEQEHDNFQRFAELIVRECADIVNQEALHTDYIPAEMNQYVFKRLMKAFDKIEEHFGVEE